MSRGNYHSEAKKMWLRDLLGRYVDSDKSLVKKKTLGKNISLGDMSIWIKDADAYKKMSWWKIITDDCESWERMYDPWRWFEEKQHGIKVDQIRKSDESLSDSWHDSWMKVMDDMCPMKLKVDSSISKSMTSRTGILHEQLGVSPLLLEVPG